MIRKLTEIRVWLLIAAVMPAVLVPDTAWSKGLTLKGSPAIIPVAQLVAEQYMQDHPPIRVTVDGGGTARGIKALVDGTVDIAMGSVELDKKLDALVDKKLVRYEIGYDAVVPVVHPDNPIFDIRIEELIDLFSGEINNWADIGGMNAPIKLVTPHITTDTYRVWMARVMMDGASITPAAEKADEDDIHGIISGDKTAVGYLPLRGLEKGIRPLSIEGRYANSSTVLAKNNYPVRRVLTLYVRQGHGDTDIDDLINYFRAPKKGQYLIKLLGMIPRDF